MAKKIEQSKVIVTKGNFALPAAGQVLWDCPNCPDAKLVISGYPGQPVAYTYDEDPSSDTRGNYITVDHTSVADTDGDIFIGQFTNCAGKSYADDIRTIAGRRITKCDLASINAVSPTCPQPQVLASYIDCVDCGDTVTATFTYTDNATQSFGRLRDDEEYITCAATVKCCGDCGDCNPQATSDIWIGQLVDGLNNDKSNGKSDHNYPDRLIKRPGSEDYPFRFFKMQKNIFTYCISPRKSDCACEGCVTTDLITGITGGAAADTEFVNNSTPDGAATYMDQLELIANQIQCAINNAVGPHAATAFVSGGTADCCSAQLFVITCDADFSLNIPTCDNGINPFPAFIDKGVTSGKDCATGDCIEPVDATSNFCDAIGVIIDQDRIECGCPCDVDFPPNTLLRTGTFTFQKNAQDCSPKIKTKELLCPKAPTGSGGFVRWAEYSQDAEGECWRDTSTRQGGLNSLRGDKVGRHANAAKFADCKKQYCQYEWINKSESIGIDKDVFRNYFKTDWYIPTDDAITIDSFTLFYEALAAEGGSKCTTVKTGPCVGHGDTTKVDAVATDCDGVAAE